MSNKRGITLIALVITIIVMLILVAVTITMAINGGLFSYAGKATSDTKTKMQEELELSNVASGGDYEDLIEKYTGYNKELNPKGKIPEGATYTIKSTSEVLSFGDNFPETMVAGDLYEYGDYMYCYKKAWHRHGNSWYNSADGWGVRVKDKTKSSYGEILQSINGIELTSVNAAFCDCTNLITTPTIPDRVTSLYDAFANCSSLESVTNIPNNITDLSQAFCNCTSLTTVPNLPNSIKFMGNTFNSCSSLASIPNLPNNILFLQCAFCNCTSLTTVPTIPKSVYNLNSTFQGCTSLEGTITINAEFTNDSVEFGGISYLYCFENTTKPIYITGTSPKLNELAATANNRNVQVVSN